MGHKIACNKWFVFLHFVKQPEKKNEILVLTWHIEFTTIEDVICLQKIEKK
jgi:hypothetical protein